MLYSLAVLAPQLLLGCGRLYKSQAGICGPAVGAVGATVELQSSEDYRAREIIDIRKYNSLEREREREYLGTASKGSSDPKRKCCMTGNLWRTWSLYILN
jgi:hypothetical protein